MSARLRILFWPRTGCTPAQGVYFLRLDTGSERTGLKAVLLD